MLASASSMLKKYSPARLGVKGNIVVTALVVTINLEVWSGGVKCQPKGVITMSWNISG